MSTDQLIDFGDPAGNPGSLDVEWIHGSASAKHNTDPDIQVHRYNEHTVILRQNMAINYEAPFIYLLFGNTTALLLDTGATASPELFPVRSVVDSLIEQWLDVHPRSRYELLVLHTHGHGDHIAGDGQFRDRPDTMIVDATVGALREHLGLGVGFADAAAPADATGPAAADPGVHDWDTVELNLGDRVLQCIATPGHQVAAIVLYDAATGLLLTGDTVYPGRLAVDDWPAFTRSIDRLLDFSRTHPVSHVLGSHIEMTTTAGVDYPIRSTYQPAEAPLQMTTAQLRSIRDAIDEIGDRPGWHTYPDFRILRPAP